MLTLHAAVVSLLHPFAPMFQARPWSKVQVLLVGAVLATRNRTVISGLLLGLSACRRRNSTCEKSPSPMLNRFMESLTYAA